MREPRTVISRAPLRVSFVGGGSDLPGRYESEYGGAVVAATIDKFVYCVARWRRDSKIYLTWREKEIVDNFSELRHGIVREALRFFGIEKGIEILLFADIPGTGSGLGSSGATSVAVTAALASLQGVFDFPEKWIAETAVKIEQEAGGKGGWQDQHISAFGGLIHFDFSGKGEIKIKRLAFEPWRRFLLKRTFALFSYDPSKGGRCSSLVLSGFVDSPVFREKCKELCTLWKELYLKQDFKRLPWLTAEHHELKRKAFPGAGESEPYLSEGEASHLSEIIGERPWKICGAGAGGHLLIGSASDLSDYGIFLIAEAWGPKLDFDFVPEGVSIVYRSF